MSSDRPAGGRLAGAAVAALALFVLCAAGGTLAARGDGNRPEDLEALRLTARDSASVAAGFRVIARLPLQATGDLAFFAHRGAGAHVYVGGTGPGVTGMPGGRECSPGVRIVDVRRPSAPRTVAIAGGFRGVVYEDLEVRRIGQRDILAVGLQPCAGGNAAVGLALYDVTRPQRPRRLGFWRSPKRGVHELDVVVRRDGTALALVSTPHSERESIFDRRDYGGDWRIIDITNPSRPTQLSEWGVIADSDLPTAEGSGPITNPNAGVGGYATYYGHSVRGADAGRTAYVSYWDAGVLRFDISDPRRPRLVARTLVPRGSEGDAHSVAVAQARGRRFILQSNEEVDPLSPPTVTTSATGGTEPPALEIGWMPTVLSETGAVNGRIFDAGPGCSAARFAGSSEAVVLVDAVDASPGSGNPSPPPCDVAQQALLAARAGAKAILINVVGANRPTTFRFLPDERLVNALAAEARGVPAVAISNIDGVAQAVRAALARGEAPSASLAPRTRAWGGLAVYDESVPVTRSPIREYALRAEFTAVPGTRGRIGRRGVFEGAVWTNVHNVEVRSARRAYASWYAGGIVALDVSRLPRIRLVGQFAPRGALFWGVDLDTRSSLVYGSDLAGALWILAPPR